MKKKFDAVEYQRKARKDLSSKYCKNPTGFISELKEKYGHIKKRSYKKQ